jgi:predicted ATPase/class 3 adenylate cyclase
MAVLPTGTVTFLFTDLAVSTRLWDLEPDRMQEALARHDEILREGVVAHGGQVVKGRGDGVHAVFATADAAVRAAIDCQLAMDAEVWAVSEPLRVRIGLHTGVAQLREADYFGSAVNRAARLMDLAHGGQIVCSQATADLARDVLAEGVTLVDLGEHRLRDLSRPERVFQVGAAGLERQFAPLASVDSFPGNLPLQVSSFIGREQESDLTIAALGEARVVTLTGVGGVGKTRLALQVAAEVLPGFREGAWLVELAGVRDPEGVVDAFAALFRVSARSGQSLVEALVEFFGTKQLLLVVDNCEHLLDPVAELIDEFRHSCPGVVVLATSREGLALPGERILAVPSLSAPGVDAALDAVAVSQAVRLFVDRAQAADATFALGAENAPAVVRVCRRLDGVPLAIELAAARVNVMSPTELAAGLDHRFDVLAGGRRGAVKRQQTLRATIDWSYDLLDDAQQRLLARFAVFANSCTRDAAEHVCAADPIEARAVFGLLSDLVDRYLVVAERGGRGTRYRLLETIREYAEERLAEQGETTALRARHGEYYLEFARAAAAEFAGPQQIDAGQRLTAERDNVLAAMQYAVDTDNVDLAFELLSSMPPPPTQLGFVPQLPAADALTLTGATEHPLYPFALGLAAVQAASHGDRRSAENLCEDALAAGQRLGDPDHRVEFIVSNVRAALAYAIGATHDAALHMEHSVEIGRATGNDVWVAALLGNAAVFRAMAGEGDAAVPLATEGLALARELEMPSVISMNLAALAGALTERDPPRARALLRESIEVRTRLGYESWAEFTQSALIAARLEDWPLTLRLAQSAIDYLHWRGERPLLAAMFNLVARAVAPTDPHSAAVLQGAARRIITPNAKRNPTPIPAASTSSSPPTNSDFVTHTRRATTQLLAQTLGEHRLHELRAEGEALDEDSSVAYALHATERALASPIAS